MAPSRYGSFVRQREIELSLDRADTGWHAVKMSLRNLSNLLAIVSASYYGVTR